jgi:VWFA-related protein
MNPRVKRRVSHFKNWKRQEKMMILLVKQKLAALLFLPLKNRKKKNSLLICALLITILCAPCSFALAQNSQARTVPEQDSPIRLRSELVEIRAVVTDKQGNPIKNLRKEDFEIFENAKPQEISFFSAKSVGDGRSPEATAPKSPAEKSPTTSRQEPQRTVVFFVDTLHISSANLLRLQEVLLKFINEKLTDGDLAAVVPSSGSLGVLSQFTRDKQVLRSAVSRLSPSAATRNSLYTPFLAARVENEDPIAIQGAMNIVMAEEHLPTDPQFRGVVNSIARQRAREILAEATYKRRSTLLTLKAVAERIAELPGQRLLLMVSEGFTMLDNSGIMDPSDLQSTISRAARSGVVINTFSAKGLSTLSFFDVSRGGFTPDAGGINNLLTLTSGGDRELENGLTRLAKETGGETFLTTNDLPGALGKALDANTYYYALSYYPSGNNDQASSRRVQVQVKGHAEFNVRAQSGYLATLPKRETIAEASDPQKRLFQAIISPLAYTEIEVDATADFLGLQTDDAQVSLSIYTDGKRLKYLEENNSFLTKLMLLTEIIDSGGKSQGVTQDEIQIRLSPEQYKLAAKNVYRYNKRLALKPGLYQIRVGVRDPNSELLGTSMVWVEIPKPNANKLIVSSITFEKFIQGNPSAKPRAVALTVRRGLSVLRNMDFIAYFCTAYNTSAIEKKAGELTARVQILQDSKTVLEDVTIPFASLVIEKENNSVKFGSQLNLKNLKAGLYEMRITLASKKSKHTATVNKLFEIEP